MEEDVRGLRWVNLRKCQMMVSSPSLARSRTQFVSHLPTDCITGDRGKPRIPEPSEDFRSGLDSRVLGAGVIRVSLFLGICHGCVPLLGHTYANEQNITLFEGDVVLSGDLENVREAHLVG